MHWVYLDTECHFVDVHMIWDAVFIVGGGGKDTVF